LTALPFEARRWKVLSANAFHLACILVDDSYVNPRFFCEESARIFCEAPFYCYAVGMETRGYRLQQFVLEIVGAIKEPVCYYKEDDLLKVTRVLQPIWERAIILTNTEHFSDDRDKSNQYNWGRTRRYQ